MKLLIINIMLTLVSATALASSKSIQCTDVDGGSDNGYIVEISANLKKAKVMEQSMAGPVLVEFGKLSCTPVNKQTGSLEILTECSSAPVGDGGYALELTSGGIVGFMQAELFELTFVGRNKIANLNCQ
ncbi:hypothetical protein K2X05_01895 [bacterium]|nr:hypothetical protein [bacterium]